MLNRAGRVVIVEGAPAEADSADGARIVVTGAEIAGLARLLAVVDGGSGEQCLCDGGPTILVQDVRGELIARWTLHHWSALRGLGRGDADLRDGPALTAWLAERGLTGSLEARSFQAELEAEEERRRLRWVRAAPGGLAVHYAALDVSRPSGHDRRAWTAGLRNAEARLAAAVRRAHPDGTERILALLAWAGAPVRESTGGLKWYDLTVQRHLLAEDPGLLLAALVTRPPSRAQLDGAAALFASHEWTGAHGEELPEPLRTMLVEHILADGTDPLRFRLRHGAYGVGRPAGPDAAG